MSLVIQTESSNASQVLPVKRKRGRPRKDQSLNRVGVAHVPPGFERVKESRSRHTDKIDDKDGMVGQAVTGVIEASFDAGYLLTVRIGNSRTILRGVVFKPGHYVPVTLENDVAPHVQMIHRSAVNLPLYDQTQSSIPSRDRNDLYRSPRQSTSTVVSKGKNSSLTSGPLVTQVGARGTVVPVVLQPLGPSNAPPLVNQVNQTASVSKDKDVVTAEPLAMLPPDVSASSSQFQVSTIQQLPVQVQTSNQLPAGSAPIEIDSNKKNASVIARGEEYEEVKPTGDLPPGQPTMVSQGSSQSSETHLDNDNSSAGTSNTESDQEVAYIHSSSVPNLRNNHATGRMTELLQALQENFDNQGPVSVPFTDSGADSQEKDNSDINPKDKRMDG